MNQYNDCMVLFGCRTLFRNTSKNIKHDIVITMEIKKKITEKRFKFTGSVYFCKSQCNN